MYSVRRSRDEKTAYQCSIDKKQTANIFSSRPRHMHIASVTTYLIEVFVGKEAEEAAHEILARHHLLPAHILRRILAEDFAQFLCGSALEIRRTLQ